MDAGERLRDLQRIEKLRELNKDPKWVNTDLYRLLYRRGLYTSAYEKLKSKPGNMTPGSDEATLDGYSLDEVDKVISSLRDETYRPEPSRVIYIPKPNGKKRR